MTDDHRFAPGIYEISADEYHADPCPEPSLSRGIAHLLVTRSPLHAYDAHPRLGAGADPDASRSMNAGTAIHTMLLGKGPDAVALTATYDAKHKFAGQPVLNYQTKAAQEERDALTEAGHIPCLTTELPIWRRAAAAVTKHLRWHQDGADFFAPGRSEVMIAWQEDGLWLRILVDRLPDDLKAPLYDLKLTDLSAAPGGWDRRLREVYAFQDAFYRRGVAAVRGVAPPPTRFVVGELKPPHGVSVMACAPSLCALAEVQVDRAIRMWRDCVREERWPGYPPYTSHVEAKPWQAQEAEDQALRDEAIQEMAQA